MSETKREPEEQLEEAIEALAELICCYGAQAQTRWALIALHSPQVKEAFVSRVKANQLFLSAYEAPGSRTFEEGYVVFEFCRLPPEVHLIPSRFVVVINLTNCTVSKVIDPYRVGLPTIGIGSV